MAMATVLAFSPTGPGDAILSEEWNVYGKMLLFGNQPLPKCWSVIFGKIVAPKNLPHYH